MRNLVTVVLLVFTCLAACEATFFGGLGLGHSVHSYPVVRSYSYPRYSSYRSYPVYKSYSSYPRYSSYSSYPRYSSYSSYPVYKSYSSYPVYKSYSYSKPYHGDIWW